MAQIEQLITYPVHFVVAVITVLILGFPVSTVLGSISHHVQIDPPAGIDPELWRETIKVPGRHGGRWIGITERLIFFLALWAAAPILVGAWLAFKVASKWETWTNVTQVPDRLDKATNDLDFLRARTRWASRTMQRFVVGTGLNLLSAFVALGLFYLLVELQPCILTC